MLYGFILAAVQIASIVALPSAEAVAVVVAEGKEVVAADKRAPAFVDVIELCTDPNFKGTCEIISTNVPSGCVDLSTLSGAPFPDDSASSAKTLGGVICFLWENHDCTGRSLFIQGTVVDLRNDNNFNDITSAIACH